MSFPDQPISSISAFFDAYARQLAAATASVRGESLGAAERLLTAVLERDGFIFSCGNGGSAAIANHLVCDHAKGVASATGLRPRVMSLSTTVELLTALANDADYGECFVGQLKLFARPGDLLITISSSGDSENVVRAVAWARENGLSTIALTGFSGGRSAELADVNLHVEADNYGIVEDVHQSLMHALAQFLRMSRMSPVDIARCKF